MDSRQEDFKIIEKGLKSRDNNDRRQAYIAKERLMAESKGVRKMRDDLVDAHRSGNKGKIEELHHRLRKEGRPIKENIERHYVKRRGF